MRLSQLLKECGKNMDNLLTLPECAAYLRLHPMTIYRFIKAGKIPVINVGMGSVGRWRFKKEALDKWMDEKFNDNGHRPESYGCPNAQPESGTSDIA